MNQIRLSELLSGKAFHWLEFFVRNIPNTRLESGVFSVFQCFQYHHDDTMLKVTIQSMSVGTINTICAATYSPTHVDDLQNIELKDPSCFPKSPFVSFYFAKS